MSGNKDKLEDSLEALFAPYEGEKQEQQPAEPVPDDARILMEDETAAQDSAVSEEQQHDGKADAASSESGREKVPPSREEDQPGSAGEQVESAAPAPLGQVQNQKEAPAVQEEDKAHAPASPVESGPSPAGLEKPASVEPTPGKSPSDKDVEPEVEQEVTEKPPRTVFETGERVVVFNLDGESFGIDIYKIRTLVKPQDIFPVPHMADYLVGLTNLRGEIVPVIDLRTRLGLSEKDYTEETRFVVAEKREEPICLIVDDVSGIEHFSPRHLEEPSSVISSVDTTYLYAIAKSQQQLVLLLDLDQVLGERILELTR